MSLLVNAILKFSLDIRLHAYISANLNFSILTFNFDKVFGNFTFKDKTGRNLVKYFVRNSNIKFIFKHFNVVCYVGRFLNECTVIENLRILIDF